ncbi:hypothetical protein BOX15_Mlig006436g2 [Macrostomum lignano]|uniref:ANK_REP_REGION domain-containing protein n=2 Tax=Macrostomum lignano TaxID=282301 RepID=A0A267FR56_9PLAT|nr:hypothetical protein BOX15_Mlig006436g2 [Macrostomum lignano]
MNLPALRLAARCGDCQQLQAGLQQQQQPHPLGANDPSRQQLLASLLAAAAAWGHLPAVRLLLSAGATVCEAGSVVVSDSSRVNASSDCQCWTGASALHWAVRRGHADVVRELLSRSTVGARLINCRDEDGATPLADCCQHQRPELARLLLEAGADPNAACSRYQRRPLHWAACSGDEALARCLIDAGAEPGAVDWRQRTAADVAEAVGHGRLAEQLRMDETERWLPSGVKTLLPDVVCSTAPDQLPHQPKESQQLTRFRSESESPPQQLLVAANQSQLPRHLHQQQTAASQLPRHLHQQSSIPSASSGWNAPAIDLTQSQPAAVLQQPPGVSSSRRFTDPSLLPPSEPQLPKLAAYSISEKPRGLCLVLSNENYVKLQPRHGTQQDAERIEQLFEQRLGFIVEVRTDLTGRQLLEAAAKAAKKAHRHRNADAFVCFLLAHGDSGGNVYGVDGVSVSLNDIAAAFDVVRCPELAGKPKAFFVQACRGSKVVAAATCSYALPPELDGPAAAEQPRATPLAVSPEGADYLFGFACCESRPAYRCSVSGSIFVQTLCDVIDNWLGSDDPTAEVDVEDALMEARRRICAAPVDQVSGGAVGGLDPYRRPVYMVPEVRSTLRFRLRLGVCG